MTTVIVDLDGTLIRENSTLRFVQSLPLTSWRRLAAVLAISRPATFVSHYFYGQFSRNLAILSLKGLSRDYLCSQAAIYVSDCFERFANPEVVSVVKKARAENSPIFLATATLDCIAAAVVSKMRLTGGVSSQLSYNQGICTGNLARDITGNKWSALIDAFGPLSKSDNIVLYTENREDVDVAANAQEVHWVEEHRGTV